MTSLSQAWLNAMRGFEKPGQSQTAVTVRITDFDSNNLPVEDLKVRRRLDTILEKYNFPSVDTTSRTIFPFPHSAVVASKKRQVLYERYEKIVSRLRKHRLNRKGIYFERMIMFPSFDAPEEQRTNQIEKMLEYWESGGRRKSAFQICIYDPKRDWTKEPYSSFPCLQHVVVTPSRDGLHLSAFYATQFLMKRAYGNYLGLGKLGAFLAYEMGTSMRSLVCYAAHAPAELSKKKLGGIVRELSAA